MPKIRKFLKYWLPVILWAMVIFSFSSWTTKQSSEIYWQDFIVKKTAHMIEFGILAILTYRALWNRGMQKKDAGLVAIIFTALYGVSDEIHQAFTPGREPAIRDVVFDTIGGIIAIYFIWNILPKLPRKLRKLAENYQLI